MYKDVWKKFGAKILIVVCSVLLLGGVAVAAPRLQAVVTVGNDGKVNLDDLEQGDVQICDENGNTQDIYGHPIVLRYKGDGQSVYPEHLKINDVVYDISTNGQENNDYYVSEMTDSSDKTYKYDQATDGQKVKIAINKSRGTSSKFTGRRFVFEYEIHRQLITDISYEVSNPGYEFAENPVATNLYVLQNDNYSKFVERIKVKVGGNAVEGGYSIVNTNTGSSVSNFVPSQTVGVQNFYFKMNNYEQNIGTVQNPNYTPYFGGTIRAVEHIKNLGVTIDGDPILTWNGGSFGETWAPEVVVPNKQLGIDYKTPVEEEQTDGSFKIKVEGQQDNCYGVVRSNKTFTRTTGSATFQLVQIKDENGNSTNLPDDQFWVPYDDDAGDYGTYLITGMDQDTKSRYQVQVEKSDGSFGPVNNGWNGVTALDAGEIMGKSHATAGRVKQLIRANGKEGYLYYNVRRSFGGTTGAMEEGVNLHLYFDEPEYTNSSGKVIKASDCIFDGQTSYKLLPQMYFGFGGSAKKEDCYVLQEGEDYTVTYQLQPRSGGAVEENSACKNAGTVIMTIVGINGYEGTIVGEEDFPKRGKAIYTISPKAYDSDGHEIRLNKDMLDAQGHYSYPLGTTQDEIIKDALLYTKNGNRVKALNDLTKGKDFDAAIYKYDGSVLGTRALGPQADLEAGIKYAIQVTFKGNYDTPKGKELLCDFEIIKYDWEQLEKVVEPTCDTALCSTSSAISGHTYNGYAHTPKVVLKDADGKELPSGAYAVVEGGYENNVDAGTNTAIVKVNLAGYDDPFEIPFTIHERPLTKEIAQFSEDEFKKTDSGWIHDYGGKGIVPELTKLDIAYMSGAAEIKTVLNAGVDFDVAMASVGNPNLYEDIGGGTYKLWSPGDATTGKEYYYEITLKNKNYQSASGGKVLYVGPFRFTPKSIAKEPVFITQPIDRIAYPEGGIADADILTTVQNYLNTIGNLLVKDGDATLTYGKDYAITSDSTKNLIHEKGMIGFTLTGHGCYGGTTKTYFINVGEPITSVKIRERALSAASGTKDEIPFENSIAVLGNTYTYDSALTDDPYQLNFLKSDETVGTSKTYLYEGDSSSTGTRLYLDVNYKVYFDNANNVTDEDTDTVWCELPISGIDGYYGEAKIRFKLGKIDLKGRTLKIDIVEPKQYVYEWKGVSIPVTLQVIDNTSIAGTTEGETLEEGKDYKIEYGLDPLTKDKAPDEAGSHWYYVCGMGRYTGKIDGHYTILPRPLAGTDDKGDAIEEGRIDTSRFEVTGLNYEYEYVPSGVKPEVGLKYTHVNVFGKPETTTETLVQGRGFLTQVKNGDRVTADDENKDENHARIIFSPIVGDKNFAGSFNEYFNIKTVVMANENSNCFIRLKPPTYDFAAEEIRPGRATADGENQDLQQLVVGQYIEQGTQTPDTGNKDDIQTDENGKLWIPIKPSEYTVEYTGNYYVSGGYTGEDETQITRVVIKGKGGNGNTPTSTSGNYSGTMTQEFTIQGNLAKEVHTTTGGTIVSKTDVTNHVIGYSDIAGDQTDTSGMTVEFRQRSQDDPNSFVLRNLVWKTDYGVRIKGVDITKIVSPKIGVYDDEETGIYGLQDSTEGEKRYFVGQQKTPIVIQGDLNGKETKVTSRETNSETIVITIPDGTKPEDILLQDKIRVTCGGEEDTLEYGKDYIFVTGEGGDNTSITPSMTPGVGKTVMIAPSPDAESKRYLTNKRLITYQVQQELVSDNYVVTGVPETIMYNHGNPVLDLNNISVRIKGQTEPLDKGVDYDIAFKYDEGKTVRSDHAVIITPKGNYNGRPYQIPFEVIRYDLEKANENKDIQITAENVATYTGDNVYPKIDSVMVNAVSGSAMSTRVQIFGRDDDRPEGKEIAFELRPVEGQDNINFQNRTVVECILAGIGNYTGEIRLKYSILQKNIEDKTGDNYDIRFFTPEQNYPYQNGESIEPEPRGEYNGLTLIGRKDTGSGSGSFGRDVPFIFTYPRDTINVGTKTITITGNGNFTGVRTLDYNITQLDLADTVLQFAEGELIYDGKEQHPSFTLSYGGKQIVTYDKTNGVQSDYIKNIKAKFENAVNATKPGQLASVTLSFDDSDKDNSNYKGTKTAQFTIQPASLDGHVTFMYHPEGEAGNMELESNLHLPWTGESVKPVFPIQEPTFNDTDLAEGEAGAIYDFAGKRNNGDFLKRAENEDAEVGHGDYTLAFKYVEPDSDDTDVKEGYGDAPDCTFAGKVKVTITGINNYKDSASFWYYIGDDISADGSAKLQADTAIYNAQKQPPVVIVNGISRSKYNVERYRGEVKNENYIKSDKDIIDAATYYVRIEGNPSKGTYASKPITLTYTIQPRALSNSIVIDGFKKEYNYTGLAICPVGISVTDYIDRTKYKLTENEDYSLTYTNNINVGTATINVNGEGNFKGTAAARFAITSSMISSGNNGTPGGSVSNGSGQISGAVAVSPEDVRVTLDAGNAMYYTGKQLTPAVTIDKMTQNTDYTVTYSNNIEVGTGVITITGMGNNTGTITKNFRIVAKLSDCKVTNIPDQQYTGSAVEPLITVTCGNSILTKDKDYTVSFMNNVEIGTATAMIRAAGNSNYVGSLEAKFNIGNNVGGFIISGYAPTYPYTGSAVTPAITVESGSTRLQQGTDYTVSYENNVNAGSASIIVKGAGKYTGTQTVNFIIEPKSIQVCEASEVEDKTYTGDAYTPSITVKDSGKVLQNGVDYTLTYSDNVNPGLATITIQGLSNNYTGTKRITFRIGGVAVNGLQVSAINATSIKLKWQQQGYADGYQVCNSKSKVVKSVNGSSASTTVTGLKPGKTYKYKVRSYTVNSQGERSYGKASAVVTATTKLKTPTVSLKRNGTGRMRIKWSKSTNADGYEIFYKNTKGAKYRRIKKINDVNTRICNVRGIKSGKKCFVRIRAFKKTGSTTLRSAMSKTKTIKVK